MAKYTEEELEEMGLTEEEMEALAAEDEDTQEGEDGDDDQEGADDEGEDEGDEEGKAKGEGDEGADEAGDDDEQEQPARAERAPILTAEDPGDTEEKLKEIATSKEKLIEQFDDGELTAKEYQIELDKLSKQEREIEQATFKSTLAREMREQQARNDWLTTVNNFLDEHEQYRKSKIMHNALDTTVRELANMEENASLTGEQILAKAHEQITAELGVQAPAPKKEEGEGSKKKQRKPIDAPPSLARVPAADPTGTEDTRWSKLDRLMETDPERYEAELAKLSDSDRDAYLQSQ